MTGPVGGAGELTARIKEIKAKLAKEKIDEHYGVTTYRDMADDTEWLIDELERAIAAKAPQGVPAPPFGPGDYSCAVCGLGMVEPCEHWKPASNTSHVETEGESGRQPEVCHSPSAEEQEWLNAPMGDRHASAERVREIECKAILDLMGKEPYLAAGRVIEGGEWEWKVVADKVSVTAMLPERALPPSTGEKSQ